MDIQLPTRQRIGRESSRGWLALAESELMYCRRPVRLRTGVTQEDSCAAFVLVPNLNH